MNKWIRALGSLLAIALLLTQVLPAVGDDLIPEEETLFAYRGENGAVMLYDSAAGSVEALLPDAGADEMLFQQDGYAYYVAGQALCRAKLEAGATAEAIAESADGAFVWMEQENVVYYVGSEDGKLLR